MNELDQLLYNGLHKNERNVAVLVNSLIHSLPKIIDNAYFQTQSPIIIRNQTINLQKESMKRIFPILSSTRQKTTDIDLLFIDDTSMFGHKSAINYFIEVEMAERDALAFQRLLDFSTYCNNTGINLFPILVTNRRYTSFVQNCCIINISDLNEWTNLSTKHIISPLDIPGISWDNPATAYHIINLISLRERYPKQNLDLMLSRIKVLKRSELDFDRLNPRTKSLSEILVPESQKDFRRRMHDLLVRMEHFNLIQDTDDKRAYQLTNFGSEYVLKWWGD